MEVLGGGLLHQAHGGGARGQPEAGQEAAGLTGEQVKLQVKLSFFPKPNVWLGSSVILPKEVSSQESRSSFKFESRGRKRVNFESSGSKGWKGCLELDGGVQVLGSKVI